MHFVIFRTILDGLIRSAPSREARRDLQDQQDALLDLRDEARAERPQVEFFWEGTDQTFAEDWLEAGTDQERRAVLDDGLERVLVARGRPGRRTRAGLLSRLTFEWKRPEEVGPLPEPDESWL